MNRQQALARLKKLMVGLPARIPFVSIATTSDHVCQGTKIAGYFSWRSRRATIIACGRTWGDVIEEAERVMQPVINNIARRKGAYP